MPDIDMDFKDDRRDEVLHYVIDRYGSDNVAQIITFGTMGAKASLRDVGRGMGMSYKDVDRMEGIVHHVSTHPMPGFTTSAPTRPESSSPTNP